MSDVRVLIRGVIRLCGACCSQAELPELVEEKVPSVPDLRRTALQIWDPHIITEVRQSLSPTELCRYYAVATRCLNGQM